MSPQAFAGYPVRLTEGASFDCQPPRTLSSLFSQRPVEKFAAGSAIFWEGDQAKHIFEVVEGTLRAFRIVGDGRRVIMGFLRKGDVLGVSVRDRYLYTVEAITPVELRRFARHQFESESARDPHLKEQLFSRLCDEMAAAQDQMALISRRSADEKVAGFLLLMARTQVRSTCVVLELPMTRLDIADYLNMTIETVSRTITKLAGSGVIATVGRHSIALLKLDALVALAEGGTNAASRPMRCAKA